MFVYRNNNTNDVVRYEHRSARLDMLPNWELLEEPSTAVEEEAQTPGPKAPQEPQEPQEQGDGGPPDEPPGGGGGDRDGSGVVERPARSASKADWVAYARTRAQDSGEEAAIDGLTKEQLIEQYGGDN